MNEYFNQYIEEYYEESEDTEEDEGNKIIVKSDYELVQCLDDVISLLKRERVQDIVVISVGSDGPSVIDTVVICSPFNNRHGHAIAETLRKVGRMSDEQVTKRSVRNSFGWFQIEIGKIQVHVMAEECRRRFDIEGLWCGIESMDIDRDVPLIPPARD